MLSCIPNINCNAMVFSMFPVLYLMQTSTDYGPYLANEPSPLHTTTIVDRCTDKLVDDWNKMRTNVRTVPMANPEPLHANPGKFFRLPWMNFPTAHVGVPLALMHSVCCVCMFRLCWFAGSAD